VGFTGFAVEGLLGGFIVDEGFVASGVEVVRVWSISSAESSEGVLGFWMSDGGISSLAASAFPCGEVVMKHLVCVDWSPGL
jgi:hypothetical protein